MYDSIEQPNAIYSKHGAMKDSEPVFMPDARGMLAVVETPKKLTGQSAAQINLHAQGILKAQSEEFARAQEWWQSLPHTPSRQLYNRAETVFNVLGADGILNDWVARYDVLPGLCYVFDAECTLNLKTGETESEPSRLFSFDKLGMKMHADSLGRNCVRYHLYFAFYEKPETHTETLQTPADSLTAVKKRELNY